MRVKIYLPDHLGEHAKEYAAKYYKNNFSRLLQVALALMLDQSVYSESKKGHPGTNQDDPTLNSNTPEEQYEQAAAK